MHLGDSGLADANPGFPDLGASRVQARWAPRVLSRSPSPTLTQLSLSRLPSPPTLLGAHSAPSPGFPCVSPFSHVCATPPRSERCPWASLLLPCSACGAVPSPLLSSASARNAMLVVPPGGGWGRARAKEWEGSAHGGDWGGYEPSALESLPPPPLLCALCGSALRWLRAVGCPPRGAAELGSPFPLVPVLALA